MMLNWTRNWRKILSLALPSLISFAMMTLSGTINLIMIGQLGATAIAIVGVTNIIIYNVWAATSGIGHSVNYLVAQSIGAQDYRKGIERTYVAFYVTVIAAVVILFIGLLFSYDILQLIGGENSSNLVQGETYLRVRLFAVACGVISFMFHGFFRGIGDTVTPMYLSLLSNVFMIFFTYAWTYGHFGFEAYGLSGAAWAFFTGELVGLIGCLYVYFIRLHPKMGTRSKVSFDPAESKLILFESGKLGVQELSLSISMLIFTMFVAVLGENALAANEIALNVMSVGFMPAFAFGATATILVGQSIGRGQPAEARRFGSDTALIGSIFLLVIGTLEFMFAEPVARIYSSDVEVYKTAAMLIMVSAYLQLFDGLLNFYAGGLRGIGDTAFLLKISFILGFCVFVPLSYLMIFVLEWGSMGAWLALYTYLMIFGLSVMRRFYKTDWSAVRMKMADKKTNLS